MPRLTGRETVNLKDLLARLEALKREFPLNRRLGPNTRAWNRHAREMLDDAIVAAHNQHVADAQADEARIAEEEGE